MGKLIVLAGNLGVGKTSLSRSLARQFDGVAYSESPPEYPYLEDMYADMSAWCFHNQLSFMIKKTEEQLQIMMGSQLGIQDRGAVETHEVFSRMFHSRGTLSSRDFSTLERTFALISPRLPSPDVLVYMHAETPLLLSRIVKRQRSTEHAVWAAVLDDLSQEYARWYKQMLRTIPGRTIALNMNEVDFVASPGDLEWILQQISLILNAPPKEAE